MSTYTLSWLPDPDTERDEIVTLSRADHPITAFRQYNELVQNNSTEWRFDGDCWHTDVDLTYKGERGGFAIFWDED